MWNVYSKLKCRFCGLPLRSFGIHDTNDSWFCSMFHYEEQKKLDAIQQPVDYPLGGDDEPTF